MDRDIYNVLLEKLKALEDVIKAIPTVETDVSGLKTDVSGLKTDVSGLKTDMSSAGTAITALQGATAYTKATLTPASEDVEFLNYNYIIRIGKLVIYHIAIRLDGTGTTIPAETWKDIMNIPEGFRMVSADQVVAVNLNTSKIDASAYYDFLNSKLQIYPYTQITSTVSFEFLMVGEVQANA